MAAFDLEEQEQISQIKGWWEQFGTLVTGAAVAAALASVGWPAFAQTLSHGGTPTSNAAAMLKGMFSAGNGEELPGAPVYVLRAGDRLVVVGVPDADHPHAHDDVDHATGGDA